VSGTGWSAVESARAVSRAARELSRSRPVQTVRPGQWVFTQSAVNAGTWVQVLTATQFVDHRNRDAVRLTFAGPSGRSEVIEARRGMPASVLTAAQARKAGLTGR